jgi:hypothetical protein
LRVSQRISGKGALGVIGDQRKTAIMTLRQRRCSTNEGKKKLQEARMEFQGHSAAVLAVTLARAMSTAAPGSSARYDEALEKVDDSYLAWRDASKTWGDARLPTSIYPATG